MKHSPTGPKHAPLLPPKYLAKVAPPLFSIVFCFSYPNERSFRGPGGVGRGRVPLGWAKICAREPASRGLQGASRGILLKTGRTLYIVPKFQVRQEDHGTTFPDTLSKILPDRHIYIITRTRFKPQRATHKKTSLVSQPAYFKYFLSGGRQRTTTDDDDGRRRRTTTDDVRLRRHLYIH